MSPGLDPGEFALVRDHLRRTAGLEFDEGRRSGLALVLAGRLAATGVPDVASYLALLEDPAGGVAAEAERQRLLDAVTIQETHFHRARPQIEALRHHVLPDVLRRASREGRPALVWSAGCSTGEEAFTLAMLMLEVAAAMPPGTAPPLRVVGTDVSTAALAVARAATYTGRTVDLAERAAVERWLSREPDGTYVVRDEVRSLVELAHHNLVTQPPPFEPGSVDLVVCRHVTIYFSRETTRALVRRFCDTLVPGGWLLPGPAESLWQVSDEFVLSAVGEAFAYRSPGSADRRAVTALPPQARRAMGLAVTDGPSLLASRRPAGPGRAAVPTAQGASPGPVSRDRPVRLGRPPVQPVHPPVAPAARAGSAVESARAAFDAGAYEQAADTAQDALDIDPVNAEAYVLLGQARLNLGEAAGAVESLQRAVFLDPLAGHAHFLLAVALSVAGRRRQAGPSYRAAANTLPGVPADTLRRMLDGRRVQELVQLCSRLADEADHGGESDAGPGGAGRDDPMRRGA